jgi:hypothetical protein
LTTIKWYSYCSAVYTAKGCDHSVIKTHIVFIISTLRIADNPVYDTTIGKLSHGYDLAEDHVFVGAAHGLLRQALIISANSVPVIAIAINRKTLPIKNAPGRS